MRTDSGDWLFSAMGEAAEQDLIFQPLAAVNDRGELEGRLARSWDLAPDDSTWTFRLRSDVKWHDGVRLTAYDVEFSMELNTVAGGWGPGRARVIVQDDTTLSVTFGRARAQEPGLWAGFGPVPKHLLEGLDPATVWEWDFWLEPVGNGPYRFVRRVPQTMVELEANPDFFLGRPRIDRIIIKQAGASAVELLSGNVDAMSADPVMAKLLAEDPRFEVYHEHGGRTLGIAWNQVRYPPFRDRRVRRALTQAIDRRTLLAVLDLPTSTPIYDVAMSDPQFRRGEYPDPVAFDPDAARRLLEEAGWRDEDGDGIRERLGEEFRFTMVMRGGEVTEATYVQEALRRVGIAMEVAPTATNARLRDADFEAGIYRFSVRSLRGTDNTPIGRWLGPESPIGYHNAAVDTLLLRAHARLGLDEFEGIFRELTPIMQEDLPITFLYVGTTTYVAHRRLRGLSTPWRAEPYLYADQLWLEDDP